MPRWLHFLLGFVTLIALAAGGLRALVRLMPVGTERWAYEAMVLVLAVGFVTIVLRAARGYRSGQPECEG